MVTPMSAVTVARSTTMAQPQSRSYLDHKIRYPDISILLVLVVFGITQASSKAVVHFETVDMWLSSSNGTFPDSR